MRFIKDKRILVMSLMDLEHCGFEYEGYLGELFLNGIDEKEAETPVMLVVDFTGGAVITKNTSDAVLKDMEQDHTRFVEYLDTLGIADR